MRSSMTISKPFFTRYATCWECVLRLSKYGRRPFTSFHKVGEYAQWPFHDGDPRALLYAIDTGGSSPGIPGDLDGDGAVATSDLLSLLGAWGDCP